MIVCSCFHHQYTSNWFYFTMNTLYVLYNLYHFISSQHLVPWDHTWFSTIQHHGFTWHTQFQIILLSCRALKPLTPAHHFPPEQTSLGLSVASDMCKLSGADGSLGTLCHCSLCLQIASMVFTQLGGRNKLWISIAFPFSCFFLTHFDHL